MSSSLIKLEMNPFITAPLPEMQRGDGHVPAGKGLGRLLTIDQRDQQFLMEAALPRKRNAGQTSRYWNQTQWWGDQGDTPQCVAYAWLHWLEDGPVTHKVHPAPLILPRELYCESQRNDVWVGDCTNPRYDGTSVRAGAKVLQQRGLIGSYHWAWELDPMVQAILTTGPVVVGTWWYESMFYPAASGQVRVFGRRSGGHAWLVNGVNTKTQMFRAKNSWGRTWGKKGNFFISFADMARLIREDGEVCLATELQLAA